jgi:hypothetical protein
MAALPSVHMPSMPNATTLDIYAGKPSKRKEDEAEEEEEEEQEEVEEEEPPKKQRKKAEPKAKAAAKDDGKKKKKKKDKNAPKRGMSAYMHFSNAKRDEVKADNPGVMCLLPNIPLCRRVCNDCMIFCCSIPFMTALGSTVALGQVHGVH